MAARATLRSMYSVARPLEDVLRDLAGNLRKLYGRRYRSLVLYGSHARGEADEGSDVDNARREGTVISTGSSPATR